MTIFWIGFLFECFFINTVLPVEELALPEAEYVFYILLNSIVVVLLLIFVYHRRDEKFTIALVGGFLFRLILMFWSEYCSDIFPLPNSGADEFTYYYNAMSALVKDKEFTGYALVFSWQARVFGLSKIFGKFVNVLFSVTAIIILRKILMELDIPDRYQNRVLAIACFMPNYAILSSLLLRESLIVLAVTISLYFFIRWWNQGTVTSLLLAIICSVFTAWLHSGMIVYTFGIICVAAAAQKNHRVHLLKVFSFRTLLISAFVAVVGVYILLNFDLGITDYFRDADSVQDIVAISDAYEDGGSAYNANIFNNESTVGFILNTPIRMFYFLMSPLPWGWRSSTDAIAFVFSAIVYSAIFVCSIKEAKECKHTSILPAMVLIAILSLMMFGWGVSNSGTALRHRDKMVMHYMVMYALYLKEHHRTFKSKH